MPLRHSSPRSGRRRTDIGSAKSYLRSPTTRYVERLRRRRGRALGPVPPGLINNEYRLTVRDLQIAVQFWYEWYDESGQWWRTYGLEDWTFADNGLMRKRQMSGNDVKISEEERWFKDGVDVNEVDISEKHW